MITCLVCQTSNDLGQESCISCGSKLLGPNDILCSNCHTINPSYLPVCSECGTPFYEDDSADHVFELHDQAGQKDEAKQFSRSWRGHAPVMVVGVTNNPKRKDLKERAEELRGELVGKVKVFAYGKTLFNDMMDKYSLPKFNRLHDLNKGHNILIEKVPPADGQKFGAVKIFDYLQF